MSKVISAGFAVLSNDRKILLGKTDKYQKEANWTIFKGQQEEGESLIETAARELMEESNIDIVNDDRLNMNTSTSPIFSFGINDKVVHVFLLVDKQSALNDTELKCNTYWSKDNPEITDYKWFTLEEAFKAVYPSQQVLIEKLKSIKI